MSAVLAFEGSAAAVREGQTCDGTVNVPRTVRAAGRRVRDPAWLLPLGFALPNTMRRNPITGVTCRKSLM
jgi:hypothetical protein